MNLRWLALAVAVAAAPVAFGQIPNARVQQMQLVEATLHRLSEEQVAIYQQFQIVQEIRRNEERLALQRMPIYRLSIMTPPPNVEDVQRDEEARTQRLNQLQAEVDRLYTRYRELEDQKRPLLETLSVLALTAAEPAVLDLQAEASAIADSKSACSGSASHNPMLTVIRCRVPLLVAISASADARTRSAAASP